ncbi:MAG TPA: DUF433 domain-containing protein [Planctomycetaceae bacterium]
MTTQHAPAADAAFQVHHDPPAVRLDGDGVLRVGPTRLLMDLVVRAYQAGATAERIAESFPGTDLRDIYGAIAYYLRHTDEVDRYLERREREAERLRETIESELGSSADLYRRLRERQAEREAEPRTERA